MQTATLHAQGRVRLVDFSGPRFVCDPILSADFTELAPGHEPLPVSDPIKPRASGVVVPRIQHAPVTMRCVEIRPLVLGCQMSVDLLKAAVGKCRGPPALGDAGNVIGRHNDF